ncbi:MAG: carboxylating nicotinate-nucleotide diphosphorylase [Chloroflexi bacterium]|nr:carboxylating nicotinate-nucleotide diphosphorylase [Chloroflexota bacterium]
MPEGPQPLSPILVDDLVIAALEEDGAFDDITTRAIVRPDQWGHGTFVARDDGIIAGLGLAAAAMAAMSDEVSFDALVEDGARVPPDAELAEVEGPMWAILGAERVALNFLQRMSGIATLTHQYVETVAHTKARILDTRKTTPGLRELERYAVRAGGGHNHRFGLGNGILVKDNHIIAARQQGLEDLEDIVAQVRASAPHTMRIEIEVTDEAQLRAALAGAPDIILVDNMSVEQVRTCVDLVAGRALVEASGGVTLDTVRAVAEAGVDYISVGRLTHSAPSLDISLELGAL